MRLLIKRKKIS